MKKLYFSLLLAASLSANAGNLWVVGDALSYGWNLDDAQALVSAPGSNEYKGTIYLKAGQSFKFLTTTDWGNDEIGLKPGTAVTDGVAQLAAGKLDEGYDKLTVAEDANYFITVSTDAMTCTIAKSAYQATEVAYTALYLVGSATEGGWSVDNATPLYQNAEAPLSFAADVALGEGTFKIVHAIKGGGSYDSKYFFFRSADSDTRMSTDGTDDRQWQISTAATYKVAADIADMTISIVDAAGVEGVTVEDGAAEYFTITGMRVEAPSAPGIYIRRTASKAAKIIVR